MRESFFLGLGNLLPRARTSDKLRPWLYRLAGMRIGRKTTIWGPVTIRPLGYAHNISIGDSVFINTECRFGCRESVTIGNNVAIGPRVSFETTTHGLIHDAKSGRGTSSRAIEVLDEAWLGAGVIVTPGVTIGRGAVIAAGGVVVISAAARSLYGGVPAKLIRTLSADE